MQDYNFYKYLHVYTYSGRATLFIVQSYTAFNPRAGNDILHLYTGNGGGVKYPPPQSIQSYDARESRTVEDIDVR